MTDQIHETREAWLNAALHALAPLFDDVQDADIPPLRISIGWPGGRANQKTTRGQCWSQGSSTDGVSQIFISPWVVEPIVILGVILHEMIHGIDNCASGHRGNFIRLAKAVGLEAKWTSAKPGPALLAKLVEIETALGLWPHAPMLRPGEGIAADTPAKQGTRMLKVVCPTDGVDGYKVRMTQSWIDKVGCPICPCHGETMELGA
jgi:hypothetical protein